MHCKYVNRSQSTHSYIKCTVYHSGKTVLTAVVTIIFYFVFVLNLFFLRSLLHCTAHRMVWLLNVCVVIWWTLVYLFFFSILCLFQLDMSIITHHRSTTSSENVWQRSTKKAIPQTMQLNVRCKTMHMGCTKVKPTTTTTTKHKQKREKKWNKQNKSKKGAITRN